MLSEKTLAAAVIAAPYPHVAVADALRDYDAIERDFPDETLFGPSLRMHGDLTHTDEQYQELIARSPAYRALHDWTYSREFVEQFLALFDREIGARAASGELLFDPRAIPIRPEPFEGRKKIGVRTVGKGERFLFPRLDLGIGRLHYGRDHGGGGIHVDNLTRLVSVLVYVGDNPTLEGGEHRLYRLEKSTPVIDKIYPPRPNYMVASVQSNFAFHDVNPVTRIEGVRKAFYLAVSCSVEIWRPHRDRRLQHLTKNRYRQPAHVQAAHDALNWARRVKKSVVGATR